MERPNKVFCLFEQSGTFKNAFKRMGIDAEDYDIKNEYGETDHQIDLFEEIEMAVKPISINGKHRYVDTRGKKSGTSESQSKIGKTLCKNEQVTLILTQNTSIK